MRIQRKTMGGITVLELSEAFAETDDLDKAIRAEAAVGNMRLVIDLSACSLLGSTDLGVIVDAHNKYAARDGELKLCGMDTRMTRMMLTTGLINVLSHYPSLEEAVASFARSTTGR